MQLIVYLSIGLALSLLLVKSAELLIKSTSQLARRFKVSEYTISFLVIGIATSLPELVVGIISALDKNQSLSYGNVLGSNIADLTVILAIPILIGGSLKTNEIIKNKDIYFTLFFGLLPLILMFDGKLSQVDGLLLVVAYIFYLLLVIKRSTGFENLIDSLNHTNTKKDLILLISSVSLLLVSADLLVKVAENISLIAKLPLVFVGLTVTALGTSLPELAFGLKAIKTNHKGEILGNIVGSVVANSTLVLGVTSIINPINRFSSISTSSTLFLVFTLILFLVFSITKRTLGKLEALILFILYLVFIVIEKTLS